MQRQDCAQSIYERLQHQGHPITHKEVKLVMDTTLDVIADALARGEKVTLTGFGTFEVRHRNERAGVNPQTGEPITIPPSKTAGFSAGRHLRTAVRGLGNGNPGPEQEEEHEEDAVPA